MTLTFFLIIFKVVKNKTIYYEKKTFYFLICFIAFISFSNQTFSQTAADSANVTFQVDMSTVSSSFSIPEVNGTFNNWCGNCWSMTDTDNDNVWEVTERS